MSRAPSPGTIREACLQASSFLKAKGTGQDPGRVAMLLLEHVTGWSRTELLNRWDERFPNELREAWQQALDRKAAGEPVQYITGEQEFYGRAFKVTPDVLIPRPETELLVERIARLGGKLWPVGAPLAADIGTGSGAIAVTLSLLQPAWRLVATDISQAALAVAAENAARLGAAGRIRFLCGDLLAPLAEHGIAADILVSNPPYIPSGEVAGLQPEVRDYEPAQALDGGEDGLVFYRRMLDGLSSLPKPPRLIGFETGIGQAGTVAALIRDLPYGYETEVVKDLAGIERHVVAWQPD